MSSQETLFSREVSRSRIHIERFIAVLKRFKYLHRMELRALSSFNEVLTVACFLTLFMPPLVAKADESSATAGQAAMPTHDREDDEVFCEA